MSRTPLPLPLLVAAALAACATQPRPQPLAAAENLASADCGHVTGSRIRSNQRATCEPVGYPFRSFSRQELETTGEIDLVKALRQLDPAFR